MLFSLESVACLGCCSLAPVLMIGETIYAKLNAAKIKGILKEYQAPATKEASHVSS
jgi:NADH:ubiquinone oxidoreductase subunit E